MTKHLSDQYHVAIMQPYFIPYRNYYGLIRRCDEFVVFDDVQFCRGWQHRNCIPNGRGGKQWITVPIVSRRPQLQRINEVAIAVDRLWRRQMLSTVRGAYAKHPFFNAVYPELEQVLLSEHARLVDLTVALLQWSSRAMGLEMPVWRWSSEMDVHIADRNERLIEMCRRLGTTHYVCGPAAKVYLRTDLFAAAGIEVIWHEEAYSTYPQAPGAETDHFVSALDVLMNHGPGSRQFVEPVYAP